MREKLGLKSYKRPHNPRLTEKQRVHRLKFCKERLNWSAKDWANVVFSDEAPFHLFEPSNRQTDRVWDSDAHNIPPVLTSKFPPHLMVWGAMSANAVSELNILPQKCTVNAKYYVDNILADPCKSAFARRRSKETILERKLCENMSKCHLSAGWGPCSHLKIEPGMVSIEASWLLGERSMARQLS